jgi:hypothetical protein
MFQLVIIKGRMSRRDWSLLHSLDEIKYPLSKKEARPRARGSVDGDVPRGDTGSD